VSVESWEARGEGSEHEEKELPLPVNPRRAQALPLLFHRKEEDDNGLIEEASYTYIANQSSTILALLDPESRSAVEIFTVSMC
jgi:hypothetical protein